MEVTLGLSSNEIEKLLKDAGLQDGAELSAEQVRSAIAKAITANNDQIIKQLSEMMGQFNIAALMQQFMG